MGLFNTIFKLGKAKAGEMEEKIEDKNRLAFARQDIEEATEQLRQSRVGLAQTKAALMGIERKIKTKGEEITDRTDKAKRLKAAEKMDLAKQQWEIKCELDSELVILQKSYEQYKATYAKQETNVKTLGKNLSDMNRALERMKTMEDVKKSNEALSDIKTDSSMSSVAKFKEREAKMQKELDASTALMEGSQDNTGDIDAETAKALGGSISDQDGFNDL